MDENSLECISKYNRNSHGLIDSVKYVFNEDGSINWRAMVDPKYLYVNQEWFEARKKAIPESTEGLEDNQLCISLGGIKELAKLRGFTKVKRKLYWPSNEYVAASCTIKWIKNYESCETSFTEWANASVNNTNSFGSKFLETIASNRSFVRCVRNFLNIHVVGIDEMDRISNLDLQKEMSEDSGSSLLKPSVVLEKHAIEKGITSFEGFKNLLRKLWKEDKYKNTEASNWNQYSDIPPKEARILFKLLKED